MKTKEDARAISPAPYGYFERDFGFWEGCTNDLLLAPPDVRGIEMPPEVAPARHDRLLA